GEVTNAPRDQATGGESGVRPALRDRRYGASPHEAAVPVNGDLERDEPLHTTTRTLRSAGHLLNPRRGRRGACRLETGMRHGLRGDPGPPRAGEADRGAEEGGRLQRT